MLTREQVLSGEYDAFLHGQRMAIPTGNIEDHEMTDGAGKMFFKDGGETHWHDSTRRMSGPSWRTRWRMQ